MSDKHESGGGYAEQNAAPESPQAGFYGTEGGRIQVSQPEGYPGAGQSVEKGKEPDTYQGVQQRYSVQQETPCGGSGAMSGYYDTGPYAGESVASGGPSTRFSSGMPVSGQPQPVAGQWHDPLHLKQDNGYMYRESQIPAQAPAQTYGQAYGQPYTQANPQSPAYPAAGVPCANQYQNPAQTPAQAATQGAFPYQGQGCTQYPPVEGYKGMPAFTQPMAAGCPAAGMQPGYAQNIPQNFGPGFDHGSAQAFGPMSGGFAGRQPSSGTACQTAHGEEHCEESCGHHMCGGDGEAFMNAGMGQGFNPFALFGPAGEAFNSQFGQFTNQFTGSYANQAGAEDPQHFEKKCGQLFEIYNDMTQGKTDPAKIMNFLTSTGTHFWKGALVGAVLTLVLTNDSVKSTLKECLGAIIPGKE